HEIDCVCDADAVLFHQSGTCRFTSRASAERRIGCASARNEDGYEVCRCVAARRGVRSPAAGAELHDDVDVDRASVWHHLRPFWAGEQDYLGGAVYCA